MPFAVLLHRYFARLSRFAPLRHHGDRDYDQRLCSPRVAAGMRGRGLEYGEQLPAPRWRQEVKAVPASATHTVRKARPAIAKPSWTYLRLPC